MPTGGISSSGQQPALATLLEEGAEENANNDGSTSHRSSSGSSDAPSEGTLEAAQALVKARKLAGMVQELKESWPPDRYAKNFTVVKTLFFLENFRAKKLVSSAF